MTTTTNSYVDYKDTELLKQYLNPHGRILGRKRTQLSAKIQRAIEEAVKRARIMGLLPFIQK
jgi:small subunit ribosomal protein S18